MTREGGSAGRGWGEGGWGGESRAKDVNSASELNMFTFLQLTLSICDHFRSLFQGLRFTPPEGGMEV